MPCVQIRNKRKREVNKNCCCSVTKSCPTSVTPWTAAHRALLSMEFPRRECWSGLPFPSPGYLPIQGSNPQLLHCRRILYCQDTREVKEKLFLPNNRVILENIFFSLKNKKQQLYLNYLSVAHSVLSIVNAQEVVTE